MRNICFMDVIGIIVKIYITMTSLWALCCLKSPDPWLFTQPFIQGADQRKYQSSASPNENVFRVTGPLWAEPPVTAGFPSQWPVTRSFDVFFVLRLNIRLSKQSRLRRFETPSRPLWRYCNTFWQDVLRSYTSMSQQLEWTIFKGMQPLWCLALGARVCKSSGKIQGLISKAVLFYVKVSTWTKSDFTTFPYWRNNYTGPLTFLIYYPWYILLDAGLIQVQCIVCRNICIFGWLYITVTS